MSATAGQAQDERGQAERLGIKPGQVVQEIGYDDDCDEQLRGAITRIDGVELVDEDYDDVVDVVLLWWRDGDGDLVDALVDALTPLADGGYIWLLTPKAGRSGHVEPSDIRRRAADRPFTWYSSRTVLALTPSDRWQTWVEETFTNPVKGPGMAVEVGEAAPDFELKDQHGTPVRLSSFRGTKNVVLVFYPLAFSGVCTGELCAIRDEFPEANRDDVELLTVSVDSTFAHRAWADAEHFQFGLLSDFWPHGEVATLYGVFDSERGLATRGTFIIDKDGVVRWKVVNPIPQARDLAEYSKALAALG